MQHVQGQVAFVGSDVVEFARHNRDHVAVCRCVSTHTEHCRKVEAHDGEFLVPPPPVFTPHACPMWDMFRDIPHV